MQKISVLVIYSVLITSVFLSCTSLASYSEKYENQISIAEEYLFNKYKNDSFVLWEENIEFQNIDIINKLDLSSLNIEIEPTNTAGIQFYYYINMKFYNDITGTKDISLKSSYHGWEGQELSVVIIKFTESFIVSGVTPERYSDTPRELYIYKYSQKIQDIYEEKIHQRDMERNIEIARRQYAAKEYITLRRLLTRPNNGHEILGGRRDDINIGVVILLELEEPINLGTEEKPYIIEPKKPIIVGAKENTYIMEIDWEYPLQFVIEDRLGVIEYENTLVFPNANGPDRVVDYYYIPRSIIIKCTSKTNITLANGRLVQRSLFTTIPFSNIDPYKPIN